MKEHELPDTVRSSEPFNLKSMWKLQTHSNFDKKKKKKINVLREQSTPSSLASFLQQNLPPRRDIETRGTARHFAPLPFPNAAVPKVRSPELAAQLIFFFRKEKFVSWVDQWRKLRSPFWCWKSDGAIPRSTFFFFWSRTFNDNLSSCSRS
jgi:hypothetical protein